jgi:hypothetical protein
VAEQANAVQSRAPIRRGEHVPDIRGSYRSRVCRICRRDRNTFRQRLYGVWLEDYRAKLAAQNGLRAICGSPPGERSLNHDHDHVTGQVRDLLCATCNARIGGLREDPILMRKAADYIERHRSAN